MKNTLALFTCLFIFAACDDKSRSGFLKLRETEVNSGCMGESHIPPPGPTQFFKHHNNTPGEQNLTIKVEQTSSLRCQLRTQVIQTSVTDSMIGGVAGTGSETFVLPANFRAIFNWYCDSQDTLAGECTGKIEVYLH